MSDKKPSNFDYMDWWKYAVKVLEVQPTEAWNLDYIELVTLAEIKPKSNQDMSFTVNAQRMANGCSRQELKNLNKA